MCCEEIIRANFLVKSATFKNKGWKMKENIIKIKDFLLKNLKWIVLFISTVFFLMIVEDVMDKEIMSTDNKGYILISTYLMSDIMTHVAKVVTNFGGEYCVIGLSILLLIAIKNKKIGISIPINLGLSALLNVSLKQILQRPRPIEYRIIDESGYSLPSGHSMVSMAFYGYLIYLIYKHINNKYIKWSLITLLSLLIMSIGISRIYLGVHYTSDVIAGFLIALSYLIIYINVVNAIIINSSK